MAPKLEQRIRALEVRRGKAQPKNFMCALIYSNRITCNGQALTPAELEALRNSPTVDLVVIRLVPASQAEQAQA